MTPVRMRQAASMWDERVGAARGVFSLASLEIFVTLLSGWILAPGRSTITAMICAADPEGHRSHDAYHCFVRAGQWSMTVLWRVLGVELVELLCPTGPVCLDLDDTL